MKWYHEGLQNLSSRFKSWRACQFTQYSDTLTWLLHLIPTVERREDNSSYWKYLKRSAVRGFSLATIAALLAACGRGNPLDASTATPPAVSVPTVLPVPTSALEATVTPVQTPAIEPAPYPFPVDSTAYPAPAATEVAPLEQHITLAIHMGSYSIDRNDLKQEEIDAAVNAVVDELPNVDYITIGTYLDYPEQIAMWKNAAEARGKKLYVRSAGFNSWQGTFGARANGTPQEHLDRETQWIRAYGHILKNGDIFEPVPDEASNGTYWKTKYGETGIGTNEASKYEFNEFLQNGVRLSREEFDKLGLTGVQTGRYFDAPSPIKEVVSAETALLLTGIGTDNYPNYKKEDADTPPEMGAVFGNELDDWVVNAHPEFGTNPQKVREITIGPNPYQQFDEPLQEEALRAEIAEIVERYPVVFLHLWQLGNTANDSKSRLFDYSDGQWHARDAIEALKGLD